MLNLAGQTFGSLFVVERIGSRNNRIVWQCLCLCGKKAIVEGSSLKSGHTKSCGCSRGQCNLIDLLGQRFGRLVVQEKASTRGSFWRVLCDCGVTKTVSGHSLRRGDTKSCGCSQIEIAAARFCTHGKSSTREYRAWQAMKARCLYASQSGWHRYGGRGVKVCDRWLDSFEYFLADMGECPEGYSIERIDVNGDYSPLNCKWIPRSEQNNNTRRSRKLTYEGKTKTLGEWAKELGVNRSFFSYRFSLGWTVDQVINCAKNKRNKGV